METIDSPVQVRHDVVQDVEGEGVGVKKRENGGFGHKDLDSPVQVGHDVVLDVEGEWGDVND